MATCNQTNTVSAVLEYSRMRMYIIVVILSSLGVVLVRGQSRLNIMFVNQEGNGIAEDALNVVRDYLQQSSNLQVQIDQLYRVVGNGSDARSFLDNMCKVYNDSIADGKPPHLVLDATLGGVPSETAKSFTTALALPTISTSCGQEGDLRQWRNLDKEEEKFLVQIMPPQDVIPEVIRSIVVYQNITNAGILFDDSFVMDHKYKSLLQNIPTRHMIVRLNSTSIKSQLQNLLNHEIFCYFILGRPNNIKSVLDTANILQLYKKQYSWHTISQVSDKVKCSCSNASILHVYPVAQTNSLERLATLRDTYNLRQQPEITASFYFDVFLRALLAVKDMMDRNELTDLQYTTCNDYNEDDPPKRRNLDLLKAFSNVNIPPSYGPLNIDRNGYSLMQFTMNLEKLQVVNSRIVQSQQLGTWPASLSEPINVKNAQAMANLSAVTFYRIVTVVQKPFVMEDGVDENGKMKFKGYCIDMIEEIRNITHFDYEIYPAPDGKFGNLDEDGNWNGMIKELMDKKADIAVGSISLTAERENVVDLTVPFYDLVGLTILMKKPKASTSLFKFLTVLESDVWLCILAAYFFTSFIMWVFDRWSPYSYQNNREKYKDDEEKREFSLKECLWFCLTSLTPQGGGEAPKNLSGRLVAATWWLFGFIIIASYTANLAAFLTVSRLDSVVESLDDLLKQYKIQYATINNSDAMTYFQRMADIEYRFYEIWKDMSLNDSLTEVERSKLAVWDYPVSDKYTKLWHAMKETGFPQSMEEAVERVLASKSSSEGFALIADATDVRYLVLTSCDLQMVGDEFSRKPYSIAVQQGSPLRDQLNSAILELLNKRKLEKLKENWWNQNPERRTDCDKEDDGISGIDIQNIGGVFIVILVGIVLACVTLAFEYWWYKYKRNPQVIDVAPVSTITGKGDVFQDRNQFSGLNLRRPRVPAPGIANPW